MCPMGCSSLLLTLQSESACTGARPIASHTGFRASAMMEAQLLSKGLGIPVSIHPHIEAIDAHRGILLPNILRIQESNLICPLSTSTALQLGPLGGGLLGWMQAWLAHCIWPVLGPPPSCEPSIASGDASIPAPKPSSCRPSWSPATTMAPE